MLRETTVGGIVIFDGRGDLAPSVAREIEARVVVLMRSHARLFVFDLSGCTLLPQVVVGALGKLHLELERLGGAIVLAGAKEEVLATLQRSVYKDRLRVVASLNLALRYLESGEGETTPVSSFSLRRTRDVGVAEREVLSARQAMQRVQELLQLLPPPPFLERLESGDD